MNTYQAVNPLETPLLLLIVVVAVALVTRFAYLIVRRRSTRGTALFALGLICFYLGAVIIVSLTSPAIALTPGTPECFDDWCATALSAKRSGQAVDVELRVVSMARGEAQRPDEPRLSLIGDDGRLLCDDPSLVDGQRPLDSRVDAGESFATEVSCDVPAEDRTIEVVFAEGPPWLTAFIAGDENSFFHKRAAFRLKVAAGGTS